MDSGRTNVQEDISVRILGGRCSRVCLYDCASGAATAPPSAQQPVPPNRGGGRGGELLEPLPMPEVLKQYQPVSVDRLRNPADGEWPMIRRTYDGWGYTPLTQIDTDNVKRLEPVWIFSTGATNGHEGSPLVVNGVMFVSTPGNQVVAINARTGTLLWRYRRPLPNPVVLNHPTTRGVAVYNNKVYFAAGEAVLVALDAKTGEEVWTTQVAENASGTTCRWRRLWLTAEC